MFAYDKSVVTALSVIIPTLNEEKYLPKLLRSLAEQDYVGKLQIVVVDGQSNDRTAEVARQHKKRFVDFTVITTDRGVSRQRNLGAKLAKHEHLLFIDADIILPRTFLRHIANKASIQRPVIATTMHLPVRPNVADYLFAVAVQTYLLIAWPFYPIIPGSFILTRKSLHEKINGFDERLVFAEDIDYGERMIAAGARYAFFAWPYILSSPRRLRQTGRLRLIYFWMKHHLYIAKNGPIHDPSKLSYPLGQHEDDD